jgi:hypothetical protein
MPNTGWPTRRRSAEETPSRWAARPESATNVLGVFDSRVVRFADHGGISTVRKTVSR